LIVAGVAQEDRGRTEPRRGLVERTVARMPCRRFRTTAWLDGHRGDLHRIQLEPLQQRGESARALGGSWLQAVVDSHRAGSKAGPRRLERHCHGEGERVGAATTCDQDQPARL
jgi:hypothetical protein